MKTAEQIKTAAALTALQKDFETALKVLNKARRNRVAALRYFDSVPDRHEVEKGNALALLQAATAAAATAEEKKWEERARINAAHDRLSRNA